MSDIRERLTDRMNRARLEAELRRALRPLVVCGVGALVGLGCWYFIASQVGTYGGGESGGVRELRFAVDDATGVVAGRHEVRFKGIPAGTIMGVDLNGGKPILKIELYKKYGQIYRNARATLRPNTALQDIYLDIVDRGTPQAGVARGDEPLAPSHTHTTVNIAEALQTFEPRTRDSLRALLTNLGAGLHDRGGKLRASFVKLVPFVRAAGRISAQLASHGRNTRRLVRNVGTLTAELARRDAQLRKLATAGGATLRSLGDSSPDIERLLAELPPTLSGVDTSFDAVRDVLPPVNRAVVGLRPAAARLPGALTDLRRLSTTARPAVASLRTPVRRLLPLARALRPSALALSRLVKALLPQLGAIDHVTKSIAGCSDALYGFFQWTASVLKLHDARGVTVRGDFAFGVDSSHAAPDPNVFPVTGCAPGIAKRGEP